MAGMPEARFVGNGKTSAAIGRAASIVRSNAARASSRYLVTPAYSSLARGAFDEKRWLYLAERRRPPFRDHGVHAVEIALNAGGLHDSRLNRLTREMQT